MTYRRRARFLDAHGRLVLRSNITPIDREPALEIDADEDAGADDVGGIVNHRSVFEGQQRRLDLAETLVDRVGQFVRILIYGLEPVTLGVERIDSRLLLRFRDRRAFLPVLASPPCGHRGNPPRPKSTSSLRTQSSGLGL